jgi:hypothetical protein
MEIPIAMTLASRLLLFGANRLANIIAGCIVTLVSGFLTFVPPLACRMTSLPYATIRSTVTVIFSVEHSPSN